MSESSSEESSLRTVEQSVKSEILPEDDTNAPPSPCTTTTTTAAAAATTTTIFIKPTVQQLRSVLTSYVRFVASPGRQDSILKTVQYSLWLLSKFYSKGTAKSLLALQGEISWARYLLRFFGLPAAILDADAQRNNNDKRHRLGQLMSWAMLAYYPLENLSYLCWKAPGVRWLPLIMAPQGETSSTTCSTKYRYTSGQLASRASAWSCRFWLAWIVLDIVRSTLALSSQNDDDDDSNKTTTTAITRNQRLQRIRNMLYVLPAINWSLPQWDTQPWLSGDLVNGFCWIESVIGLYQGITNFEQTPQ